MRWKGLRNTILVLLSIGLGVFLSSMLLLSLYEDEFGGAVVEQLKKNIKGELSIEDQSFTIWRSFPLVSCDLRKVEISDKQGNAVVNAEILGLRLNLYNILRKSLEIKNVLLRNGIVHLEYDHRGRSNLEFLTAGTEDSPAYFKDFNLDYLRMENMDLQIVHHRDDWSLSTVAKEAELSYHQTEARKEFDLAADMVVRHFSQKDWHMDQSLKIETDLRGAYQRDTDHWLIQANKLYLNGDKAQLNIQWPEASPDQFSVDFAVQNGDFSALLQMIMGEGLNQEDYKIKGDYSLRLKYQGNGTFKLDGDIKRAFFKKQSLTDPLENISSKIVINKTEYQSWKEATFAVHDLKLSNKDLSLTLKAKGNNLSQPKAVVEADGTLSLNSMLNLFDPGALEVKRGIVNASGLSMVVEYKEEWAFSDLNGLLTLNQVFLNINGHEIEAETSKVELKNDGLLVRPTEGKFNGETFHLGLRMPELKKTMAQRRIPLVGELKMNALTYEELMSVIGAFQEGKNDSTEIKEASWSVDGQMLIDLKTFLYDKVAFADCAVDLEFEKNQMDFSFKTEAFEGKLKGNGIYKYGGKPNMELHLLSQQVEIKKLLQAFDDFDQEVISYKNIKGKTDAHSVIRAFWNKEGEHLMDELQVYSDLDIRKGELIGVDMLYQFSNWIKLRDLMHIKFNRLQNHLEISDGRIYIPQMFVQSNAMNLSFAGIHSFENEIDYSFKINAGQVLWNKVRKYEPDKSPLPAKKEGMFNMFFKLRGTVEDYEVDNDRSAVRTHLKNSLVHEEVIYKELQRAFPSLLKEEEEADAWMDFGINERTDSERKSPIKEAESLISRKEDEFIEGF